MCQVTVSGTLYFFTPQTQLWQLKSVMLYGVTPFEKGQGLVLLTNVICSGRESFLLDCTSNFAVDDRCLSHSRDVGVKCERELTL